MRILYDSKNKIYKSVFGCLEKGQNCQYRIDIPSSCLTEKVELIFEREDGNPFSVFSLSLFEQKDGYDIYNGNAEINETGLYFYYFRIKTKNECFSLYKYGYDMTNMEDGEKWQVSVIPVDRNISGFYAGKVMYQIFPDRFFKCGECDTSEKLRPFTVHENTGDTPCYAPDEEGKVTNSDFFGGNLKGIIQKIPYIKSLGVSVIYLNPIFKAYSNHRYDTADYKKIDEMLGTEQDFEELCKEAHKNGIRIILDGVFSHTGSNSVYFDKEHIFGNGAYSNTSSPYRKWYSFQSYPDEYTSWWGIQTLPCVNETEESYLDFMFNENYGVIPYWLGKGCDGFRLDVADELPDEFIEKLNSAAKTAEKESFIIGEVWEDASNKISYGKRRKYFTSKELDSVMNYPFKNAILDFVSGLDDGEFFRYTVMTICENYPQDTVDCLMNFLSTHDTARALSVLGKYEKTDTKEERADAKMSFAEYEKAVQKLFCAVFLQFVLPGMACIYYGDEVGMEGFEDPFCRRFMEWEKTENNVLLDFFRNISFIRNTETPLQKGKTEVLNPESGVVCIKRIYENQIFSAYCNISSEEYVTDSVGEILLEKNCETKEKNIAISKYGFILIKNTSEK